MTKIRFLLLLMTACLFGVYGITQIQKHQNSGWEFIIAAALVFAVIGFLGSVEKKN